MDCVRDEMGKKIVSSEMVDGNGRRDRKMMFLIGTSR